MKRRLLNVSRIVFIAAALLVYVRPALASWYGPFSGVTWNVSCSNDCSGSTRIHECTFEGTDYVNHYDECYPFPPFATGKIRLDMEQYCGNLEFAYAGT